MRRGSLQIDKLRAFAQEKLQQYDVRARDIDTACGNLSGGNQQKVVVARELSRDLRLLVAAQPWSSRPSSTRSSRSPTGSWSSTAAASWASCPATPRASSWA